MTIEYIKKVLENHYIPYYVENNNVYADTMEAFTSVFVKVENISRMTKTEFYKWLGY